LHYGVFPLFHCNVPVFLFVAGARLDRLDFRADLKPALPTPPLIPLCLRSCALLCLGGPNYFPFSLGRWFLVFQIKQAIFSRCLFSLVSPIWCIFLLRLGFPCFSPFVLFTFRLWGLLYPNRGLLGLRCPLDKPKRTVAFFFFFAPLCSLASPPVPSRFSFPLLGTALANRFFSLCWIYSLTVVPWFPADFPPFRGYCFCLLVSVSFLFPPSANSLPDRKPRPRFPFGSLPVPFLSCPPQSWVLVHPFRPISLTCVALFTSRLLDVSVPSPPK